MSIKVNGIKKITNLTAANTINDADVFMIETSSGSRKVTGATLKTLINDSANTAASSAADGVVDIIGAEFDANNSYEIGDYVIWDGKLYKFTSPHETGAFDGTDAEEVILTDELVSDVKVNGNSIVNGGVANIPIADIDTLGVIKMTDNNYSGLKIVNGYLATAPKGLATVKAGQNTACPIVPATQHMATFYGLAKAAGHDERASTEPFGTYTDEAKTAIQTMLGTESKIEEIYTTILDTTITTAVNEGYISPCAFSDDVMLVERYKYRVTINDTVVESIPGIWYEDRDSGLKGITFIGNPNLYNNNAPRVINSLPDQNFCIVYVGDLENNKFQIYTSEAGEYNLKIERITYNKSKFPNALIYGNDEAPINRLYINDSSYQSIDIGHNSLNSRGSIAIGTFNTITNEFGVAIGMLNTVSGQNASVMGVRSAASGYGSHAEGSKTMSSGFASHAEGSMTIASGHGSHAEGDGTQATGSDSHSEGSRSVASGGHSHAEGYQTVASRYYSHSEGADTLAGGNVAHAEGYGTKATGMCSHSEGQNTIASSQNQHAQGKFNIEDSNNVYAEIIGNGTAEDTRSNAYALDWEGNGYFAGDIYVGCSNDSSGGTKLATINDIVSDVQINGTSIVSEGVANIPIAGNNFGAVKINPDYGVGIYNGFLLLNSANLNNIKSGNNSAKPISAYNQHQSVFYGLAKAAGDTTQSQSSNAVGTYTEEAKTAIKTMLGVNEGIEVVRLA